MLADPQGWQTTGGRLVLNSEDEQRLLDLRRATVATLRDALAGSRNVALVDAPNQRNVGDSLIWAGEVAYFRQLGLRVRYVADLHTYDARSLRRSMPNGIVLLHGGGNLGDLWPGHQLLRERVLEDLPDYRVVQLPQSIEFTDPLRADAARQIMERHHDFHLLIRDSLSLAKARDLFPEVNSTFCPDMALGWDAPRSRRTPRLPASILAIARADKEASSGLQDLPLDSLPAAKISRTDWYPRGWRLPLWNCLRRASKLYELYVRARRRRLPWLPVGLPDRSGSLVIAALNRLNISGAVALYRPASVVISDRLHAHVLAALMGREHVVLDNNYRKVSTIFDDYTGRFSTANYSADLSDAKTRVAELAILQ